MEKQTILKKIILFSFYMVLSLCSIYLINNVLLSARFMQVFNIDQYYTSDIYFNDLYYSKFNASTPSSFMKKKKNVVFVNVHDIPTNERESYSKLINQILTYQPKAVGIDVSFSKRIKNDLKAFNNNSNIIFAKGEKFDWHFKNEADVTFPKIEGQQQQSIRYYSNHSKTFAAQLVHAAYPEKNTKIGNERAFLLHYNTIHDGVSHMITDYLKEKKSFDYDFKYLNSEEVIADSSNEFKSEFQHKIVIIGYLGNRNHFNAQFDIEDKYKVPSDTKHLVNKDRLMNGAVIHGVAISNMLEPTEQFTVVSDNIVLLIQIFICGLFLWLLLFFEFGKLMNRFFLFLLSIPLLYLILYFMDQHIYLKLGTTLFALLIVEEMIELIEPLEKKYLSKYIK